MKVLALDFETSGTDPRRHAPVSVGYAVMEGADVLASEELYVGPTRHWKTGRIEREYDVCALEVSGASWPKVKASPPPAVAVGHMARFAEAHGAAGLTVVAFKASFDMAFYDELLWLASDWHPTERGVKVQPPPPFCGPWQCALALARRSLSLRSYTLDDVAAHFGLSRPSDRHGALEDAVLCGRVYARLAEAVSGQESPIAMPGAAPAGGLDDALGQGRR